MSIQFADVKGQYEKCRDLKREEVLKLKEWVEKQPHLPNLSGI